MTSLDQQFEIALGEIGEIHPKWSEVDQLFYFDHEAYPGVQDAASTEAETIKKYKATLRDWIAERLAGNIALEVERITSGRGGARPGAGRPPGRVKEVTKQVRLPADLADWLKADPKNIQRAQKLIEEAS